MTKSKQKILTSMAKHFFDGYTVQNNSDSSTIISPSGYTQVFKDPKDVMFISIVCSKHYLQNKIQSLLKEIDTLIELDQDLDKQVERYLEKE